MLFQNRADAGRQLGRVLSGFASQQNTIVIGLPRGGVVLAYEVAKLLDLDLDVICPRKIGAPFNPEFAIGAITESGEGYFDEKTIQALDINPDYLIQAIEQEKKEAQRRLATYRNHRPPLVVKDKTILLVDDGIATGATVKAAILSLRKAQAGKIIVAVPVAPKDTLREIQDLSDEVICLSTPSPFHAVGQFYLDFSSTTDQEVCRLMDQKTH